MKQLTLERLNFGKAFYDSLLNAQELYVEDQG
jgi:hypothetical protein